MAVVVPKYFYGCDGFKDHNWGCCYRCGQMLAGALGLRVPELPTLMSWCGTLKAYKEGRIGRPLWIEPPDVARCVRRLVDARGAGRRWKVREWLYMPDDRARSRMLRCSPDHYRRVLRSRAGAGDRLRRHLRRHRTPVVVDNGISAYVVVGMRCAGASGSGPCVLRYFDPHQTQASRVENTWTEDQFWAHPLWMMATARPRRRTP